MFSNGQKSFVVFSSRARQIEISGVFLYLASAHKIKNRQFSGAEVSVIMADMYNPERGLGGVGEVARIPHGREAVPVQAALDEQKELVLRMTPVEIRQSITDDENDPILEALMMRYLEKYVTGEFNGFADFCNENECDLEFIERAKNESLTEADFQAMISFLQQRTPFFTEEEVSKFIEENKR